MTTYNNLHPLEAIQVLNDVINDLAKVNFTDTVDLHVKYILNIK